MALRGVWLDELRDMCSAENQLIKALPKLAKGAKGSDLKKLFKEHFEETNGQVLRLKEVFQILQEKPTGQHCSAMEGVVDETADALEKDEEAASLDPASLAQLSEPSMTRLTVAIRAQGLRG